MWSEEARGSSIKSIKKGQEAVLSRKSDMASLHLEKGSHVRIRVSIGDPPGEQL